MNTVRLVLKNGSAPRQVLSSVDVTAAVFGAAASDLLPDSFRNPHRRWTMAVTLAGAAALYLVVRLAA